MIFGIEAADIFWTAVLGGTLYGVDKGVRDAGTSAHKAQGLAKWIVIGGGLYVAYEVARKAGYAK